MNQGNGVLMAVTRTKAESTVGEARAGELALSTGLEVFLVIGKP